MDTDAGTAEQELVDLRRLCTHLESEIDYLNRKVNALQMVYADILTELFITDRALHNALVDSGSALGMEFGRAVEEHQYNYSREKVRKLVLDSLLEKMGRKFQQYYRKEQEP